MRRRHRRLATQPELDITAFLNLMIVLVPVLLLGMVFSQIRMIELNFPGMEPGEAPLPEDLVLVVSVWPGQMELADSERGVIETFPVQQGQQDVGGLQEMLKAVKARMPDKTDIVIKVAPDVDYQTLVTVMDSVRSYPAIVVASVVEAELFPNVSLGEVVTEVAAARVRGER